MTLHKKLLVIGLSLSVTMGGVPAAWSQTNKVPSATAPDTSPSMPMPWWKTSATTPATNSTGAYQCSNTGAGPTDACPSPGAGNPINIMSGNKYQREEDMPALPGVLGLEIVRHYNSFFSTPGSPNGIMGRGWRLSYETELHVTGRVLQLTQADGTRVIFNRDPLDQSLCASANPADGRIVIRKTARGDEYTLILPNGRKLDFSSQGKLAQILAPTGEFVTLQYDVRGMLQKVMDPQGRTLQLRYLDKAQAARGDRFTGVVAIDSPVGRFKYEYGSDLPKGATLDKIHVVANLVKVSVPTHYDSKQKLHAYTDRGVTSSSIARVYHYEDALHPTLLTGVTITGTGTDGKLINQRIGTYGYNANGLGILTVKGEPARFVTGKDGKPVQPPRLAEGTGIEQVTMDYREPGQTTIKNSLGQETVYKYAIIGGGLRLLEVRGAGCASCGEPNMRYRYDRMGRPIEVTKLTLAGQAIQTTKRELDYFGRVLKVSSINYQGGKPGKEQWLLRYEYQDDNLQPKLIVRPSVVTGLEAKTRIVYGTTEATRYLPAQVTESGYVPTLDGKRAPQSISRTIRYSYDNEGQRVETDGPLPNAKENAGPDNSDITRTEYDPRTKLPTRIVAAGGITTEVIERDDALRPTVVRNNDGVRMVETRVTYSYSGQVQVLTQQAGFFKNGQFDPQREMLSRTTSYTYDATGRLASIKAPDGTTLRTEYNVAGQPIALLDPKGNRIVTKIDSEGRLLAVVTQDHQGHILDGMLNLWDERGDLRARLTPVGLDMATSQTPIPGQKIWMDANGGISAAAGHANRTELLSADQSARSLVSTRGGVALIDPANRAHAILNDDFGRPVVEIAPDEGRLFYRYDDTIFQKRHTSLNGQQVVTETLEFAVNGRLTKRVRAGCTEKMHYEGDLLARLDGCGNSHVFKRDAFGQIVQHTQLIQKEAKNQALSGKSPAWLAFTTEYSYDPVNGRLIERTLPDGQHLRYRYDPIDGKPLAVNRDRGWLAWLDHVVSPRLANGLRVILARGITDEPVLADISHRPFGGIDGATASNGLRSESRFNAAGRLVAMMVSTSQSLADAQQVESISYDYDAVGNMLSMTRNGNVQRYEFDRAHRLTKQRFFPQPPSAGINSTAGQSTAIAPMSLPTDSIRYLYDPLGRRLSSDADIERDAYGRQIHRGQQRLVYDDAHRLIEVTQQGRSVARYRYDALGNRIAKTIGEKSTYFLYDTDHKLVAEMDEKGKTVGQYLYIGYRPYAVMHAAGNGQARNLYAIHADERGLPLSVTDERQRVVWQSNFDAFGKERSPATSRVASNDSTFSLIPTVYAADVSRFKMPLRLAGQYEDIETGLYYNVHRFYDPGQGRYITPDPIGVGDGNNRYGYVGGNPLAAVDPQGLFEVPFTIEKSTNFFGNPEAYSNQPPLSDDGHGDIVHIAFAQYEGYWGKRFSQTIIDQIVKNNYHSDALPSKHAYNKTAVGPGIQGGGQFNVKNHFDNPNDGPMCKDKECKELLYSSASPGEGNPVWIRTAEDQLDANRRKYRSVDPGTGTGDVSSILSAFGQNSHALADFYAHTNWVDASNRGGRVENKYKERDPLTGKMVDKVECGWVPVGLNKTLIWDEDVSDSKLRTLYTGTVQSGKWYDSGNKVCGDANPAMGDVVCGNDKTTHGYWNKDHDKVTPGEMPFTEAEQRAFNAKKMFFWEVQTYSGKPPKNTLTGVKNFEYGTHWYADSGKAESELKSGDRIYVAASITNHHRLAFYLAIEHTKKEIARLYEASEGTMVGGKSLQEVFQMDRKQLDSNSIEYIKLLPKN